MRMLAQVRMCAYKLLRVKFNWGWGLSSAVEKLIVSTECTLFREVHLKAATSPCLLVVAVSMAMTASV